MADKQKAQVYWDYYNNDVMRPPYFPQGEKEDWKRYKKRLKLALGWPAKIVDRVNSYFRKPPIRYIFTEGGKVETENAKLAAEVWDEMLKTEIGKTPHGVCRDGGVSGIGNSKLSIGFFEMETGDPLKTIVGTREFAGRVTATRVNDSFVYWDRSKKYGNTYIEAWARRGDVYRHITDISDDEKQDWLTYIEVIQPAAYDTRGGDDNKPELLRPSRHLIIKNGDITYDEPVPYKLIPVQRWVNSINKDEHIGMSDISKAIHIARAINFIVSGSTRSIHYHGWPLMMGLGVESGTEISVNIDGMLTIPPAANGEIPKIDLLTWDQNISGALDLIKYLEDAMCSIEDIPRDLLHSLNGVGNVPSGVALRTMYEPLNDRCDDKAIGYGAAEERYVKSCLDILATHNNFSGFDNVEVQVIYNPDRTPRDLTIELEETERLRAAGAASAVDSYLAAHPETKTRADALKQITETISFEQQQIRAAIQKSQPMQDRTKEILNDAVKNPEPTERRNEE